MDDGFRRRPTTTICFHFLVYCTVTVNCVLNHYPTVNARYTKLSTVDNQLCVYSIQRIHRETDELRPQQDAARRTAARRRIDQSRYVQY